MNDILDRLCNILIKPQKHKYFLHDLGNYLINNIGIRKDFQIQTHDQLKLQCSYFKNLQHPFGPLVIYLHSFNGSRLQSLSYIEPILKHGYNVCIFDFAGCGMSEGQCVSLGYFQKYDILHIIKYFVQNFNIFEYILWGRSMGASSIIKFMQYMKDNLQKEEFLKKINILSIILDSSFCSLNRLAIQIAQKEVSVPQLFIKAAFTLIKSTIQQKMKFQISELQLLNCLTSIKCPVLILASKQDKLVNYKHSQDLYEKLKTKTKQLLFIDCQHNQSRDIEIVNKIIAFMKKQAIVERRLQSQAKNKYIQTIAHKQLSQHKTKPKYFKPIKNQNLRIKILQQERQRNCLPKYMCNRNNKSNDQYEDENSNGKTQKYKIVTNDSAEQHMNIINSKLKFRKQKITLNNRTIDGNYDHIISSQKNISKFKQLKQRQQFNFQPEIFFSNKNKLIEITKQNKKDNQQRQFISNNFTDMEHQKYRSNDIKYDIKPRQLFKHQKKINEQLLGNTMNCANTSRQNLQLKNISHISTSLKHFSMYSVRLKQQNFKTKPKYENKFISLTSPRKY